MKKWPVIAAAAVVFYYGGGGHVAALAGGNGPSAAGNCPGVGSVPASMINGAARQLGVSCRVVQQQIIMESGGDPGAVSPAGAEGAAQFMPGTWAGQGCPGSPYNVGDAMSCYAKYMSELKGAEGGNLRDALAAYNAGQGNLSAGYGYADSILSAAGQ